VFSAFELPSIEVPQELSGATQNQETKSESFQTILVTAVALSVVLAMAAGLLVYHKKHKRNK
jgi:Na+(H+)/acetate symporter ActP